MAELESVGDEMATMSSLVNDFRRLGLKNGMHVVVHSSLRSIGWVCGGAVSVILALEEVLGPEGTLVMPSHSYDISDPLQWINPPVPSNWIERIRSEMPLFYKDLTPTTAMGKIAETFRKQDGVVRSIILLHLFVPGASIRITLFRTLSWIFLKMNRVLSGGSTSSAETFCS